MNTLDDVAAASAAYLFNLLPELEALSDRERYERLVMHFRANLEAYLDERRGLLLALSRN